MKIRRRGSWNENERKLKGKWKWKENEAEMEMRGKWSENERKWNENDTEMNRKRKGRWNEMKMRRKGRWNEMKLGWKGKKWNEKTEQKMKRRVPDWDADLHISPLVRERVRSESVKTEEILIRQANLRNEKTIKNRKTHDWHRDSGQCHKHWTEVQCKKANPGLQNVGSSMWFDNFTRKDLWVSASWRVDNTSSLGRSFWQRYDPLIPFHSHLENSHYGVTKLFPFQQISWVLIVIPTKSKSLIGHLRARAMVKFCAKPSPDLWAP
jgi:hypothetical protein